MGTFTIFNQGHSDQEVKVYRNPGQTEFETLMGRAEYGELKGILTGNDIFVWDGDFGVHQVVANAIGLKDADFAFYIRRQAGNYPQMKKVGDYYVAPHAAAMRMQQKPTWNTLIKNPTFMTMLGTSHPLAKAV